ncbi:MAG: iodotyrosine deiodinase [Verrucomicrobiota bacterium]|jgi:hypothetical protein
MKTGPFVPAPQWPTPSDEVLLHRAKSFYETMQLRRTVRDFSDCSVPRKVIEDCIRAAGTAPNGANLQPWHFVAISDPELKRQIRVAAEIEEGFLNGILGRPPHEKPFLLLVVGHPAEAAMVPNIFRKPLEEISSFRTGEG